MRRMFLWSACVCALLLLSLPAFSQTLTSNITTRAEDSTGAVVPGVEVTISSPAMIGGARKEVTDETGQYRFTLLPPGTYRVSFALPGFKTLNIDDNGVVAGTTITVVGKMEVATTAEEVTVNSQAPTIDLEEATIGSNISQKMMDELPWSRSLYGASMMMPGVYATSLDIGNSNFGTSSTIAARNGGRSGGNVVAVDGLSWCQSYMDYGSFEEMSVSTNAKGADQMNAGITLNTVVKSGGNTFHGSLNTLYQNGSMQSVNIDNNLLAQGYPAGSNKFTHFTDYYFDVGGPILKDKLWFYTSERWGYQGTFIPGFLSAAAAVPGLGGGGVPSVFYTQLKSYTGKFTYQLSQNQKLEAYMGFPDKFQPYRNGGPLNPREAGEDQDSWSSQGPMLTYTNILDAKTTLTGKFTRGGYYWPDYGYGFNGDVAGMEPYVNLTINGKNGMVPLPTVATFGGVNNVGIHISDNTNSGSVDGSYNLNYKRPIRWQESVDFSRFQTIHQKNNEMKVGFFGWWDKDYTSDFGYPYQETFTYKSLSTESCPNGSLCSNYFQHPYRVTLYDYPNKTSSASSSGIYRALYFNDKITWNRKLTLNVGVRWDYSTSRLPTQGNTGEGPFATKFVISTPQNYYANPDGSKATFPSYSLWSPRISFAYDVTGSGRLAIKASYGTYVGLTSSPGSQPGIGGASPIGTTSCNFNWDGTFPYVPNFGAQNYLGSPTNVGLVSSCAKLNHNADGSITPIASYNWDPNLKPSYETEYTGTVDFGINKDFSVRANVQRKFDHNTYKTINLNLPTSAYTGYKCAADPGIDGKTGTADDNPFNSVNGGQVCSYSVPTADPRNLAATNTYYAATDEAHHEGDNSYTAFVFSLNKNYSRRNQFTVSYAVDMSHTVNLNPTTTINSVVYGSNATGASAGPNAFFTNAYQAASPTVWSQSLKINGIYGVPDIPLFVKGLHLAGVQWSTTILSQNQGWYGRSATVNDANGTAQSYTTIAHWGRYPQLTDWDQQIRKTFKIGERQSVQFTWDLYNTMNSNTIQSWRSTSTASSLYLQPDGATPLRPGGVLSPRIYEWGVHYKF